MTEGQGATIADTTAAARPASLNYVSHVIVGLAIGLIAPFTLLAWPFAILTGIVIGRSDVERSRGIASSTGTKLVRLAAVTGGVLAMIVFGAVLGGLIGFLVMALAALSERAAADASPTDRSIARVVVLVVAVLTWIGLSVVLGGKVDIRIGG